MEGGGQELRGAHTASRAAAAWVPLPVTAGSRRGSSRSPPVRGRPSTARVCSGHAAWELICQGWLAEKPWDEDGSRDAKGSHKGKKPNHVMSRTGLLVRSGS